MKTTVIVNPRNEVYIVTDKTISDSGFNKSLEPENIQQTTTGLFNDTINPIALCIDIVTNTHTVEHEDTRELQVSTPVGWGTRDFTKLPTGVLVKFENDKPFLVAATTDYAFGQPSTQTSIIHSVHSVPTNLSDIPEDLRDNDYIKKAMINKRLRIIESISPGRGLYNNHKFPALMDMNEKAPHTCYRVSTENHAFIPIQNNLKKIVDTFNAFSAHNEIEHSMSHVKSIVADIQKAFIKENMKTMAQTAHEHSEKIKMKMN